MLVPNNDDNSVDDCADIEPFCVPDGFVWIADCPELSARSLKKAGKFAYKFPEGWDTSVEGDS